MLTDKEVVSHIKQIKTKLQLIIGFRHHGGKFRTVYLEAPEAMATSSQRGLLQEAKTRLEAAGLLGVTLTSFNNPPYKNARGELEQGHPRHGDPLLEIDSVWWED